MEMKSQQSQRSEAYEDALFFEVDLGNPSSQKSNPNPAVEILNIDQWLAEMSPFTPLANENSLERHLSEIENDSDDESLSKDVARRLNFDSISPEPKAKIMAPKQEELGKVAFFTSASTSIPEASIGNIFKPKFVSEE